MVFEKCYSRCCESERTYRKMKKMTRKMRKRQFFKNKTDYVVLKRLLSLLLCTLLGSNIFSFPAGTFESMIFPFPRWDMDPFPEVSLSESNSWCVSG